VLADLKEMKQKYRLNDEEYLDRIRRESRSNARRLDRVAERETKRACLKCRKPGHVVADCPEMQKDNEEGAGICYKCGSTEHSIYKCKVKLEPGQFPFAKCFICHEVGHITKQVIIFENSI
jgi:zinc finger CCHC domain-containing protein 9